MLRQKNMDFILLTVDNNMNSLSIEIIKLLQSKNIDDSKLEKLYSLLNKRMYPNNITSHFELDYNKSGNSYFIYNEVKEIVINMEACEILEENNLVALKNKLINYGEVVDVISFFVIGRKVDLDEISRWQDEIELITDEDATLLLGWEVNSSVNKEFIKVITMLSGTSKGFNENVWMKNIS